MLFRSRLEGPDGQSTILDQSFWTVTDTQASLTVASLLAGSYTLSLSLWGQAQDPESSVPVYSIEAPVSVEIFKDYTSTGVFTVATWAASQDFLYHPDRPVKAVEFVSGEPVNLTVYGAAGLQLYLVKVNTSAVQVEALATGSAVSTWDYQPYIAAASEPAAELQSSVKPLLRQEHEAALLFNANPPPLPSELPVRSLARTIVYGETVPEYQEGITKRDFWVEGQNGEFITIPATLQAIGTYSYVWVADDNYSTSETTGDGNLTATQAGLIRDKFDGTMVTEYKDGIFRNVSTIFGHEYGGGDGGDGGRDGDQHISILLYDIDYDYLEGQNSGILGYFWGKDY